MVGVAAEDVDRRLEEEEEDDDEVPEKCKKLEDDKEKQKCIAKWRKEKNKIPRWGGKGYWVKLGDILSSEGELSPGFNPDYPGPYEIVVQNSEV